MSATPIGRSDLYGRARTSRARLALAALLAALAVGGTQASGEPPVLGPQSVQIVPASPTTVGNCLPLGNNTSFGFSGFIYRNVPAFRLVPGRRVAFDMGGLNAQDTRRNVYFATANRNPGPGALGQGIRALGWTRIASDDQSPESPRGNTVKGDYELVFRSEAEFVFPGGGLIVGFGAAPPGSYADGGCEQVLVRTDRFDASGRFYARFYFKPDLSLDVLDDTSSDGLSLGGIVIEDASDLTPPVTTVTIQPAPNDAGWHASEVFVRLSATDPDPGSGVAEVRYSADGRPEIAVSGDEADIGFGSDGVHTLAFYAVDAAGNAEAAHLLEIRIDRVAPDVVAEASPPPGADDWISPAGTTVTFSASDAGSGVAACDPPVEVLEPGIHEVSGTCTDAAGNTGEAVIPVRVARSVSIDVRPGSAVNPIGLRSNGTLPFAILSGPGFDAPADVEWSSLTFGRTGREPSVRRCHPGDVDGDGADDLVCHADAALLGLDASTSELFVRGFASGVAIRGADAVVVVGR